MHLITNLFLTNMVMKELSIENRELLLKDLSARLLYGVKVNHKGLIRPLFSVAPTQWYQITLDRATDGNHNGLELVNLNIGEELKPYLRSMSSMTEDEMKKYHSLIEEQKNIPYFTFCSYVTRYLDSIHVDHRAIKDKDGKWKTMIQLGLALEAPEGMYKL